MGETSINRSCWTGYVKPIEAIFCKFESIVTSISFVMSSWNCNAMLSSGFLASKVRKVIHSVCTSGIWQLSLLFLYHSGWEQTYLSHSGWAKPQLTSFHKLEIGKNRNWECYEDQIWPVLTQYHELQTGLKCFRKEGYKWCLLECVDFVCANNFSGHLLKVILGIQKFHQYASGVMASSSAWRTASMREEIMDKSSCSVWRLFWAWPLMVRCNPVDKWLQWWWTWIEPCILPKLQVHGNSGSYCQG